MRHCRLEQEVPCWFQCWKNRTCFICSGWHNNWDAINVKIDASFLEEKLSLKMLRLSFFIWIGLKFFVSITKTFFKEIGAVIHSLELDWRFFLLRLFFICVNLPNSLPLNTFLISGLVKYFPLIYDLNGFNSRVNRHLHSVNFPLLVGVEIFKSHTRGGSRFLCYSGGLVNHIVGFV